LFAKIANLKHKTAIWITIEKYSCKFRVFIKQKSQQQINAADFWGFKIKAVYF
jgi:hypothetical protein